MNKNDGNLTGRTEGFVLYVAILTILLAGTVGGVLLYSAFNHSQTVRRWHAADQCLLDAQSGLERVKYELLQSYMTNQIDAIDAFGWFQAWTTNAIGTNPLYRLPASSMINDSTVTVTITNVFIMTNAGYVEVELLGAARRAAPPALTRTIRETMRVAAGGISAYAFDYAYLLNNSGNLLGSKIINGDVRVNGDLRLANTMYINGNRYGYGKVTANARYWSLAAYQSTANTSLRARPTTPTTANGITWPMGYNAVTIKARNSSYMSTPFIGEINSVASNMNGRISRGGTTLAVNVYAGAGPDGLTGTADDNCLVLDGSTTPVTINGAVVVKGDLIIRGNVSGQGAIYAGRNIHIVDGISYVTPPTWPKPDSNPFQTAANNTTRDLLVLAAKGNIVVGNYTTAAWSNLVWSIMTDNTKITPFTVDASDAVLGYDSDNNPANGYLFDGRYYLNETNGGRRLSGIGTGTVPRKYFESSLAYSTFNSLCSQDVPVIDAALFSNHAIIGNWGSSAAGGNSLLNGALICHDDLNNFYGTLTINWDIRLGSMSNDRINNSFMSVAGGTGDVSQTKTISWREIH